MKMPPRPLQFTIRALLGLTVAVALVFGTLKWVGLSPRESLTVTAILAVGALAAVGLILAIASSLRGD